MTTAVPVKQQPVGKSVVATFLDKLLMKDVEAHLHLFNDDEICGEVVMGLICAIIGLPPDTAYMLVMQAHVEGQSCLFVGKKSICQNYKNQFDQHGVTTMVIEPNT